LEVSTLIGVSGSAARIAAMAGITRLASSSSERRHGRAAWTRPHVDDVGAFGNHAACLIHGGPDRGLATFA